MPTTSNFGWTTPADTDLVKDGAAAIRTLGNGIDASLLDLKGGTTGQILSKASNTDLDYTWIANDQGDITEVQAGTGISVASGTGPVPVITNTVATAFDAAGDLVYGTGADTFTKLTLGTAGQVLKVNSGATAPEWGSAAASFVGVEVKKTSSQTIQNATYTAIQFDAEGWDTDGFHDNSTNNTRLTIPSGKGGYYLLSGYIVWNSFNGDSGVEIRKNGTTAIYYPYWWATSGSNNNPSYPVSVIMDLQATDFIECRVYQDTGVARSVNAGTRIQLTKVG